MFKKLIKYDYYWILLFCILRIVNIFIWKDDLLQIINIQNFSHLDLFRSTLVILIGPMFEEIVYRGFLIKNKTWSLSLSFFLLFFVIPAESFTFFGSEFDITIDFVSHFLNEYGDNIIIALIESGNAKYIWFTGVLLNYISRAFVLLMFWIAIRNINVRKKIILSPKVVQFLTFASIFVFTLTHFSYVNFSQLLSIPYSIINLILSGVLFTYLAYRYNLKLSMSAHILTNLTVAIAAEVFAGGLSITQYGFLLLIWLFVLLSTIQYYLRIKRYE